MVELGLQGCFRVSDRIIELETLHRGRLVERDSLPDHHHLFEDGVFVRKPPQPRTYNAVFGDFVSVRCVDSKVYLARVAVVVRVPFVELRDA